MGIICADTFRAGAFDQLKQNAAKIKVPFYGRYQRIKRSPHLSSYSEADPASIVKEGLEKFKNESYEIIIIDTSGRHKQEVALFDEMKEVAAIAKPDNVILVMDGSIGQAAESQAKAFKDAVGVGSVIITKLDGHAKGGGALSAVAMTQAPVVFIGTGEHMHDLEPFNPRTFVNKMLGMGDIQGLMETVKDQMHQVNPMDLMKKLEAGIFSLRDLYNQLEMIMKMGPLSKVMSMMPGFSAELFEGSDGEMSSRLRRCMTIMDSMTAAELDSDGKLFSTQANRRLRVALGSGSDIEDVDMLLQQHKHFSQMIKKMGGNGGLLKTLSEGAASNPRAGARGAPNNMARLNQQLSSMVPPGMLQQMGGMGGLQDMMRQMQQGMSGMGGDDLFGSPSSPPSSQRKTTGRR